MLHATSRTEAYTLLGTFPFPRVLKILKKLFPNSSRKLNFRQGRSQSGFQVSEPTEVAFIMQLKKNFFHLFNEGVTEKLSFEVFKEYRKRVGGGGTNADFEKIIALRSSKKERAAYAHAVELVNAVVAAISRKTGVDEKTAWNGIIHGYMTGQGFKDSEVEKLADELFGPEFLPQLAAARSTPETDALIKNLSQ